MTRLVEVIGHLAHWAHEHGLEPEDIGVALSFKNKAVMHHAQSVMKQETPLWEIHPLERPYVLEDFRYEGINVKFTHRELPKWEPPQLPRSIPL